MIETAFRAIVIGLIATFVISVLGTVAFDWTLETSSYLQGLTDFLAVIYWILPIEKLTPIIWIFLGSMILRTIISLVKTIWQLFPLSG